MGINVVEGKLVAKEGMKVGIVGVGGLGQFAARMAVLENCEVYAVDTNPDARAAYDKQYNILTGSSSLGTGLTTLPDYAFMDMDEDNQEKIELEKHGNLFSSFMGL